MKIADTTFRDQMSYGKILTRTYRSSNAVQAYVPGTDITEDAKTDTAETLTVDKMYANMFYVDDFEAIQNKYDMAVAYGRDNGVYLANQIDADVLGEVLNATSTVDDGTLGGTSGNGITVTTSNVSKLFSKASMKLYNLNVGDGQKYAVVSPNVEDVIVDYVGGRQTNMGDELNRNGLVMEWLGWKIYRSTQLTGTAVLSLATTPTDGDTVTIQGQVFTFKTTLGSTAGNVLIGGSADVARANLAALINAPTTTTANGVALTADSDNARLFDARASAVNDNTANTLTLTFKGAGTLAVSEALTDGTDTWTSTKIKQHCLFGIVGNPTLVVQRAPKVSIDGVPKRLGSYIKNGVLYGVKTFADNAKRMVNVEVNSSSF